MIENANDIRFRCSSLGHIMTDGNAITEKQLQTITELQGKAKRTEKQEQELTRLIQKRDNPELSQGVKTHCVDVFVSERYGRKEEVDSKMLEKGNEREEDSITLLSRTKKIFFKKNSVKLQDDFIKGEPDLFIGEEILRAKETLDTKTSWSAHTFFRAKNKPLDDIYYWQGQGYMALTGAKKHTVVFCLVNGLANAIMDEKKKLAWRMGILDTSVKNPEYIKKCQQIEINHIFDMKAFYDENPWFVLDNELTTSPENWEHNIPMEERIHTFEFERNEADIEKIRKRVAECRTWMNESLFIKQFAVA